MSPRIPFALSLSTLLLAACGGTSTPAQHASLFGQSDVTFAGDYSALGDLQSVLVGGIHAYNLRTSMTGVTVTLQGAPTPGAVDVQLIGSKGTKTLAKTIEYDPPSAGVPLKWMAFGASLSQSFQSNGIDAHSQIYGSAGQLARAAGVFLGLPLFTENLAPPQQPSDFDANCYIKQGHDVDPSKFVNGITDSTGEIDFTLARVDPTLTAQNIAAGGSNITEILNGGTGVQALFEHIIEEPMANGEDAFNTLSYSQIGRIEQLDPDVVVSADLLANDTDPAVIQGDDIRPDLMTTVQTAQPILQSMMQRLGKLHAQVFIANMPSLTFVPAVGEIRAYRLQQKLDTAASYDAKVKQIDDNTTALNDALAAAMQPYPNLHLVDFHGAVETLRTSGITIGSEVVKPVKFGGLLSLDDLHFTDTGYALVANVFIDAINPVLHTSIPHVDLVAVHAADALSAAKLHAAGLRCAPAQ